MNDLVRADGHLTDGALALAADGDGSIDEALEGHLETCEACTDRLVAAAERSVATGDLLRLPVVRASLEVDAPRGVPWGAVSLALMIVLLGVVPAVARFLPAAVRVPPSLAHAIPVVVHGLTDAVAAQGRVGAYAVTLASAAVLMAVGAMVSRTFGHEGAPS